MKISRKQIRRIVKEEVKRELPISYYSDEMLMQEGLLDFLGNMFGKLIDFLFGDAEEAAKATTSSITKSADSSVAKVAKKAGLEDVESIDDLDFEDKKHQKVFYAAIAPVVTELSKEAVEHFNTASEVKNWAPEDDSEEAAKKWSESPDGEAAGGLYSAAGTILGFLNFFSDKGISAASEAREKAKTALKADPGSAVMWIAQEGIPALEGVFEAAKAGGTEGAEETLEALGWMRRTAEELGKKISEAGKEAQEEANESLQLRKLINALVLQERLKPNI